MHEDLPGRLCFLYPGRRGFGSTVVHALGIWVVAPGLIMKKIIRPMRVNLVQQFLPCAVIRIEIDWALFRETSRLQAKYPQVLEALSGLICDLDIMDYT